MSKKLSISLLTIAISFILLMPILTVPAQAQTPTVTPTQTLGSIPTLTQSPNLLFTPTPAAVQYVNPNVVTFAQLQEGKMNDKVLTGPYDYDGFGFALPADWALKGGSQIDLLLGVSFNSNTQNRSDVTVIGGGTLTVSLNNVLLTTLSLNELGEVEAKIPISSAALEAVRSDGVHILWFGLESAESCRFFGQSTRVFIHPTSFLTLPHDVVQPSTNLATFPRPIFQDSFNPDTVLFVLPDQPSPAELQAALTVAAGFGKLSSNKMIQNITTVSGFNNEIADKNHLIFVGKAASLPLLAGLNLPLPITNGQFQLANGGPDDGFVEMVDSPWSNGPHVVLVVSANTDQGIIKAARAVSTGVLRPNRFQNLAVIDQVNLTPASIPQAVDRTLADFGYSSETFDRMGYNAAFYTFNIPAGMSVSPEAYFEIVYGHSALINYDGSQITILLNNQPIGSVRMSDATAGLPINKVKIMIPPSVVRSGDNSLEVQAYLVPIDDCTPPDVQGLWVNIWDQSMLHLPQVVVPVNLFAPQDLAVYPAPFSYDPELSTTAFVLERNNLESWRNALQISAYLGWQSSGSLIALSAFYGDGIPAEERQNYNLLIIGRPSQLPIMAEMNDNLPAPFSNGSDIAIEDNTFQVAYRVPSDSPMGFIETMQSPWNPNNVILAILGNTTQGVNWSANALIDPTLRSRLGGNYAAVNDRQILVTNTLYSISNTAQIDTSELPGAVATPLLGTKTEVPVGWRPPGWILPVLGFLVGLIVVVVSIVFVRGRFFIRGNKGSHTSVISDNDGDSKK